MTKVTVADDETLLYSIWLTKIIVLPRCGLSFRTAEVGMGTDNCGTVTFTQEIEGAEFGGHGCDQKGNDNNQPVC